MSRRMQSFQDYFFLETWKHQHLTVKGISSAGMGTAFLLPEHKISVDVAQGLPQLLKAGTFLITHAHMDHAAGIPYIISQKALLHAKPPVFYMPGAMLDKMERVMQAWQEADGHSYQYSFREAVADEEVQITPRMSFRPFQTVHRVPSLGYTIFENRKKLKQEFVGKPEADLLKLKQSRVSVTERYSTPIYSYTGDTKIDFWWLNPAVLKSKVLFLEATYLDDQKSVAAAQEWGHIHLQEIVPRLSEFKGEKLVFTHVSSRYAPDEVEKILDQKIPKEWRPRVDYFPKGISTV